MGQPMRVPAVNERIVTVTVRCPRCHLAVEMPMRFDANDQRGMELWYDYPCSQCRVQIRINLILAEGRKDD